MSLDLDLYFEHIGWTGDRRPTLATLAGLLRAHMLTIPFENLDVLLHRPVRLDLDGIQDKLVRARRGGYCFEHSTLFAAVLQTLGFRATRHSARVVLYTPRTESERAHMFLTVELPEGTFVVDPGFGGPGALFPVPLRDPDPEGGGAATHWMVREDDRWILRVKAGERQFDGWVSSLEEDYPVDFAMANHFTATHPASPFVNMLMMNTFKPNGQVTLMNRDYTIRQDGHARSGQLEDRAALRAFVIEHFNFDVPDIDRLHVPAIPQWPCFMTKDREKSD